MKTISLKGKEYAPVSARVEQFHKDHPRGTIRTKYQFNEGYVIFCATVALDFEQEIAKGTPSGFISDTEYNSASREFTGHAFGKVGQEKAFEKIETTAVGRALAFAGYLAGGEIASYDEMEAFVAKKDYPQPPSEDDIDLE